MPGDQMLHLHMEQCQHTIVGWVVIQRGLALRRPREKGRCYPLYIDSFSYTEGSTTQAATPTFSPAAGTYSGAQSVTISDATSGATIYYTTNGTTPTTSSTKYTGTIR